MSNMMSRATKRRRAVDETRPKTKAKRHFKKQKTYHSSSEDDEDEEVLAAQRVSDAPASNPAARLPSTPPKPASKASASASQIGAAAKPHRAPRSILKQPRPAVTAAQGEESDEYKATTNDLEKHTALNALVGVNGQSDSELEEDDEPDLDAASDDVEGEDEDDMASESGQTKDSSNPSSAINAKKKRNDPSSFAMSFSKILDTKLTTSKRQDPVLSRSKSAAEANKSLADAKLEQKARAQIKVEKRLAQEKGRVKDVLGLEVTDVDTGAVMAEEKRLKKTAQRGVVKLFNAVRAAQVKADLAMQEVKTEGVVGIQKRDQKVNEMSKQGFLDLISSGGKQKIAVAA